MIQNLILKELDAAMKKLAALFVLFAALAMFTVAEAAELPTDGTETYSTLFVTPEWLKANLGNVLVIDARDPAQYTAQGGHIPGAVNAAPTYFANMNGKAGDTAWHTATAEANMIQRLGKLGVDSKREVIVYGDGGTPVANPGWVVWILRMSGNKSAKILDGGFAAWKAAGGKTSTTAPAVKAAAHPAFKYDPSYIATNEYVKEKVADRSATIVDIREDFEYTGRAHPYGERRPGHIPGAVNFPWSQVLTNDFTIVPEAQLTQLLAASFPNKEAELILYDSTGVRAAFMTMVFRMAGYKNARNFDAGFHAWWGDASNEVVQGPNP